jgi:A/G-specific adenine glycosylase
MLQQTQVPRVMAKYDEWLKHFPTLQALAQAPLSDVLRQWQGLGYNRRALALRRTAEKIITEYDGRFPKKYEDILELPGIGPYTAGAVMAFAYNKPVPIIETNIRAVFIHFFFKDHAGIHDKELMPLIEGTLHMKNPREWYYALMDYGSMLKATMPNPSRRSVHHAKQSPFKGSNREIRSTILKIIAARSSSGADIENGLRALDIKAKPAQIAKNIEALANEGFIKNSGESYIIAE